MAIDDQCGELLRAHSILICLQYAADHCKDKKEFDTAYVAEIAAALILKAHKALDIVPLLHAAERISDTLSKRRR
jgi:hypothetical protein